MAHKGFMPKSIFKKGDPRCNRKGNPRPPEIRKIKDLTADEFARGFNDLLRMTHTELYKLHSNPETPILRAYLAKCLLLGKLRGDYYTMNLMMDRIVGKVKEPKDPDQIDTLRELLAAMLAAAKVSSESKEKK